MKGFIEVTGHVDGDKHLINTAHVVDFFKHANTNCTAILLSNLSSEQALGVEETYSQIKALIEEAQKEDGVQIRYVPYVPNKEPQIVPLDFPKWTCNTKEDL